MLIMTFTACNKGGKENDIAHETPISEETTITIGSTETTSTAQITSAMSTKPLITTFNGFSCLYSFLCKHRNLVPIIA